MNQLDELPTGHAAADVLADRRRPGRPETANPALFPLLRDAAQVQPDPLTDMAGFAAGEYEEPHDLAAAQGILVAVLLSIPLWLLARGMLMLIFS